MLGDDKASKRKLVLFLIDGKDTDRPRRAINNQSSKWKPADIARIDETQALLTELGPTMVEMELSAP